MSDVDVTLSYPWQGHAVGERISVDPSTARRLVRGGVALFSTTSDARTAGGDTNRTATKRRRKASSED